MTDQPEQLMFHGREIAMTAREQAVMRHKLLAYTISKPSRVPAVGAFAWVRRHAVVASALAVLLALGATGVSANMAGPNDALYNFKLQVNDRIEAALATDEDAKLDVELRQIERQLDAEELGAQQALADDSEGDMTQTPAPRELNKGDDSRENLKAQINGAAKVDGTRSHDDESDVTSTSTPKPKLAPTPRERHGDDSGSEDIED